MKRKLAMIVSVILAVCLAVAPAFAGDQAEEEAATEAPVAEVTGGQISGAVTEDGAVEMFKGIPYAAPPVGELRWQAPQDVIPWDGVLECTEFGNSSYQGEESAFGN